MGMTAPLEVLTVGHSNHEEGPFLDLLGGAGVETLVDVRANPRAAGWGELENAAVHDGVVVIDRLSVVGIQLGGMDPSLEGGRKNLTGRFDRVPDVQVAGLVDPKRQGALAE